MSEHDEGTDDLELAELRALRGTSDPGDVEWETPPAGLWDRIEAEVRGEISSQAPDPIVRPADEPTVDDGVVTPLSPRRERPGTGRRLMPWLVAAAAVLVVVAGVGFFLRDTSEPTILASTQLDQLGESGAGTAELLDADGTLQLRLDTEGLDPGDGFVEVWVIDSDVSKLVSLGPLREDGVYDLPAGLDAESFPVVDVSYEPFDGNPEHSGNSALRGTLEF